ncbi:MAG: restriction endonuclease subunit S [Chloroflexi bacterium]|nr:restriction endonuclease subunit S [Chloroflexota bacterium]
MTTQALPKNWVRSKVSKAATVVMGQSPDSRSVNEEQAGIPFLQGNAEFTEKHPVPIHWVTKPTKLSEKGDILISVRAPVGEINIADKEYCIGRGLAAIRFRKIDNQFGWYAIAYHKNQLIKLAQGSTFTAVSSKDFLNFEIIHPNDPDEQRAIADILSTVDEAITQSESLVRKYQSIKQGLMSDLLTRGVDENGELRPTREEAPRLYRATPLGWLPKEWEILKLRDTRKSITSGSRWWARYYSDEGALFLRIGNLTREHINLRFDSIQRVRVPNDAESKRTAVSAGDVLISVTADLGIIGVIPENFEEAYVNQHIALVKVNDEITNPRWLGHFLAGEIGKYQFQRMNDSGAKAGLNLPTVDSLSFANPPRNERDLIVKILDKQDDMITVEQEQVRKYQLLKQGLMQDLLSGQVRVKA